MRKLCLRYQSDKDSEILSQYVAQSFRLTLRFVCFAALQSRRCNIAVVKMMMAVEAALSHCLWNAERFKDNFSDRIFTPVFNDIFLKSHAMNS